MLFDKEKMEEAVYNLLKIIDKNPEREGLKETPKRVTKMLTQMLEGQLYTNDDIANMFNKTFECDKKGKLVTVMDIPIFSFCEHHLALMYNMKVSVGYVPTDRVIGLSKIARIADLVGKRLQLQEKIGDDILEILQKILETENVIVAVQGEHSCMTARGIQKVGTVTKTIHPGGKFANTNSLKTFMSLLKNN